MHITSRKLPYRASMIGVVSIASLFIVVSLFASHRVLAQEKRAKSGIEIAPAFVEVDLTTAAQSKEIKIELTNHSPETVRLRMFPIDFKQSDEQGRLTFFTNNTGTFSYSLSSFLSFEADQLILSPKEKKIFTVVVRNRADLSPGGHYAAVVGSLINEQNSGETQIAPAVSSLILLRKVGGEYFNLSLKEVGWPERWVVLGYPSTLTLMFQNEGNIHMIPYGRAEIRDIFGRLVYKGIINTSSTRVFPESRRRIDVEMKKVEGGFPFSINILKVEGQDSLKKATYSYREYFLYVNPFTAMLTFTAVVIALVGIKLVKKKSQGHRS